jgi:hypothetical protein
MIANQRKLAAYRQSNLEAARIVAADPVKYPGIMQEWAQLVLRQALKASASDASRHPLPARDAAPLWAEKESR